MSAILFNNPYAAPPPAANPPQSMSDMAITAIPSANSASTTQDATLYNGSGPGRGTSKQAENVAIFQTSQGFDRPPNATGGSVINAQAQKNLPEIPIELGPDLPDVEMPDPLPTSPFLLNMKKAG